MQSLTAEYNIECAVFRELLRVTGAVVTGSAALAGYLKQEGQDPGFIPNTLDIYLHAYPQNEETCPFQDLFTTYLKLWGWKLKGVCDNASVTFGIVRHVTYANELHYNYIQLSFIETPDLETYIQRASDLSCVATWWDEYDGCFKTLNPELTLRRQMYPLYQVNIWPGVEMEERHSLYIERGFTFVDGPCNFQEELDLRQALEEPTYPLRGKTAFDVFSYEDVDVCEFLKASPWHIILKAGETLYAFHRKSLCDYMKTKAFNMPLLCVVYDTPNHQSITEEGWNALQNGDYSIYELQHEYSTNAGNSQKSIYTLHCYKVSQWPTGDPNKSYFPPMYEVDGGALERVRAQLAEELGVDQYENNLNMINYALDVIETMQTYFHVHTL